MEARDELSETLADCACQCFPWTVLDTAYFGSLRETSPQKRSLPFSVTHLRFSSRHSVIPRDDSVGSVVPFATSWLQFALLNRNDLHAASRKSYGYYNSCACISSGGAAPFIQPASRFPDTYTASHTGPGEIGILFANCFSQQTFWYILSCLVLSQAPFSEEKIPRPPVSLVAHKAGSSCAPAGDPAATSRPQGDPQGAVCIRFG